MKIDTEIVKEINAIEIKGNMTFQQVYNKFYKILKKHKIYQWKKSDNGNGHHGSSPEYVMCHAIFKQHLEMATVWFTLGTSGQGFKVPDSVWEGGKSGKK